MAITLTPSPKNNLGLYKVIRSLAKQSGRIIYFGIALLAIYASGGVNLPPELIPLVSMIGGNILSNILERVIQGESIPDDEILKAVENAIEKTNIENKNDLHTIQRLISHLFREFKITQTANKSNEKHIIDTLNNIFIELGIKLDNILDEINTVSTEVEQVHKKIDQVQNTQQLTNDLLKQSSFNQRLDANTEEIIDEKIEQDVMLLRKSRFFPDFPRKDFLKRLSNNLIDGGYKLGSPRKRCWAIAWCSRLLSDEEFNYAEELLNTARKLGSFPEIEIAQAFLYSSKKDKIHALDILTKISTPISNTASLMIVSNCDGREESIKWFETVGLSFSDLDPDGKYFFLQNLLVLGNYVKIINFLPNIYEEDLLATPALNNMIAIANLLIAVPNEFRPFILNQLPLNLSDFPLSSTPDGINAQRTAIEFFIHAKESAEKLGLTKSAEIFEDYALWLEIKDPQTNSEGIKRLKVKIQDPKYQMRYLSFAISFGLPIVIEKIESLIDQEIARYGKVTFDVALSRYSILLTKTNPKEALEYFNTNFSDFERYLDPQSILSTKIDILSATGQTQDAYECLEKLKDYGIPQEEVKRLEIFIKKSEGINPVESLKIAYINSNSFIDLKLLVDELEKNCEWKDLSNYALKLFELTSTIKDAERYALSLFNTSNSTELIAFIIKNEPLLTQSVNLQVFFCNALYNQGQFLKAKIELLKYKHNWLESNYFALKVPLDIAIGDWNSLIEYIAYVYKNRNNINGYELLRTAQLAEYLNVPNAKELVYAAVEKENNNAIILINSYMIAVGAGWEGEPEVGQWLQTAAQISDKDGPIQQKTLKDIIEGQSLWDKKANEIGRQFQEGVIPIIGAGIGLNQTPIKLILSTGYSNLSEYDPRFRKTIPTFSGNRAKKDLGTNKSIGLDFTSIILLEYLDLLELTIDSFDSVFIPHSTLMWLFEEKRKVLFHQPSQIKKAKRILELISQGYLEEMIDETAISNTLVDSIGYDLALMIEEANKEENETIQKFVVRSSPVFELSSLMNEEADLSEYMNILCCCSDIIRTIRQIGGITQEQEERAINFLKTQEKPWGNQLEITQGAVLFLDEITVEYFNYLGILEKLKQTGFVVKISSKIKQNCLDLINYEKNSADVISIIEKIRTVLNRNILCEKIQFGKAQKSITTEDRDPLFTIMGDLFSIIQDCETIIIDDRYFNQNAFFEHEGKKSNFASTIDILDYLRINNYISLKEWMNKRNNLRASGFCFVPITSEEIIGFLNDALVKNNELIETREMKICREYYLQIQMGQFLQLPREAFWLDSSLAEIRKSLLEIWKSKVDITAKHEFSNWVWSLIDIRYWANKVNHEDADEVLRISQITQILDMVSLIDVSETTIKKDYLNWLDHTMLLPLMENNPEAFTKIVEIYKNRLSDFINKQVTDGGSDE